MQLSSLLMKERERTGWKASGARIGRESARRKRSFSAVAAGAKKKSKKALAREIVL
jgi:hypothetical protein